MIKGLLILCVALALGLMAATTAVHRFEQAAAVHAAKAAA